MILPARLLDSMGKMHGWATQRSRTKEIPLVRMGDIRSGARTDAMAFPYMYARVVHLH